MKLGLQGLHRGSSADPERLTRRAKLAEEAGFESLWVGDHIALPLGNASSADDPAFEPRLEALVALSYLAAVTTRLRLAVGVIVLPQRQPVLLAKQLTSIDLLSNGRLIVGIGVGYVEAELRALGASLVDRGLRGDEYLAAMRELWGDAVPSFTGRFVSFAGVLQRPRPVQQPHPPILFGGHSAAAYRRAIRAGNGWYGWRLEVQETAAAIAALGEAGRRYERPESLGELEITITPPRLPDLSEAQRYSELGVDRLVLVPDTAEGSGVEELIERVAETLVDRV